MSKHLKLANDLSLPIDAVTSTVAVLGKKGSGKSTTAKKLVEEMLDNGIHVVILDLTGVWWGLKSSADGKSAGYPIAILGGEHADVELRPEAGEVTARAIVESHFNCIVDVRLFTKSQAHRFATEFFNTLYRVNREALHLVVDEADFYAPQKPLGEAAFSLGALDNLVRRGRAGGTGLTLITQRPQVLSKDVLTQADFLFALRMNHPLEINSIEDWVKMKGTPEKWQALKTALPGMPTGETWLWAPEWDVFTHGKVEMPKTFDSMRTPKPGEARRVPKVLAEIDFKHLGERIAATVEEQKANDPAALKARIRELERKTASIPEEDPRIAELHVARAENNRLRENIVTLRTRERNAWQIVGRLHHAVTVDLAGVLERAHDSCEVMSSQFEEAISLVDPNAEPEPKTNDALRARTPELPNPIIPKVSKAKFALDVQVSRTGVNKPQQQILDAIATFNHANVPARPQAIAGFCGTTKRARGFEENIRQLRAAGLIDTPNAVLKMTGNYGTPTTLASGMDAIRAAISGPQFAMLELVRRLGPIDAESIAEQMDTTVRARGFEENLRRLRADELLVGSKDSLSVAEWLR